MKPYKLYASVAVCCLVLTGCNADSIDIPTSLEDESNQASEEISGTPEETSEITESIAETQETTEAESRNLYYITSNGTQDIADMKNFLEQIETDNYILHEVSVLELPADAEAVIFNSPTEDLTSEEYAMLNAYMTTGGHMLVLLPASESETRYKYLGRILEQYYIQIDYDRITDSSHTQADGSIQIQAVNYPDRMTFFDASMEDGIVYLRNVRSFHPLAEEETAHMDAMLETLDTAVGVPFGGVEDDPLTYENEVLMTMMYTREEALGNSSVIVMGSSDFLLDAYYDADTSKAAQYWAYSAIAWLYAYDYSG